LTQIKPTAPAAGYSLLIVRRVWWTLALGVSMTYLSVISRFIAATIVAIGINNALAASTGKWLEQAMRMAPSDLGRSFLATSENSRFLQEYRSYYEILRQGTSGEVTMVVGAFYPDGTSENVTVKSLDELEAFIDKNRLLLSTYESAIAKRGFKQLAHRYDATVSQGCSDRWFTSGQVNVRQDGFRTQFLQGGNAYLGAVVEDTVTVFYQDGASDALSGKYAQTIQLRDRRSKCTINLRSR
jgi:hypothetical protein